jgi:hypothetical protein
MPVSKKLVLRVVECVERRPGCSKADVVYDIFRDDITYYGDVISWHKLRAHEAIAHAISAGLITASRTNSRGHPYLLFIPAVKAKLLLKLSS